MAAHQHAASLTLFEGDGCADQPGTIFHDAQSHAVGGVFDCSNAGSIIFDSAG